VNSWKVILATMFIFGTGVVTGGLLVQHAARIRAPHSQHPAAQPRPPAQPASAGGARLEFLRRAQRELDLTPEQRERVDKILKESQERYRKLMEPISPQIRQELQQTKLEFREVLTPEQRARLDDLLKQQHQQQQQQHHPPGSKAEHPPGTVPPPTNPSSASP
jgi:Spy/CpxP family protein refolding chaperone